MSILLKHINEPPPPIPGLAFGFQYVLDRALAKKPEERFQTPNELAAAFNEVIEETSGASTIIQKTPKQTPLVSKAADVTQSRKKWIQAALAGTAIMAMGAIFLFNRGISSGTNAPTVSPTMEITTSSISSPLPLGPTGLLRFQDGNAILDRVTLTAFAMPAPPAGSQYEAWLIGPDREDRLALGTLLLQENGQGVLTFDDEQNRNLLSSYDGIELTIKPEEDAGPDVTERVAYSYTLPQAGVPYVRQLLVSFPMAPGQVALIHGLLENTQLIAQSAKELLMASENEDDASIQKNAETIMNLLVGDKSQVHKDWNGDGQISDPGDGFGFLINSDNLGYIQALYSQADYAANSPGASQNMIANAESMKICAQNLAQWATELRDHVLTILTADSLDLGQPIRDSAAISDQMLNGRDEDNDGKIESVSSECGVLASYEHAYRMVDMPLLPVNTIDTPTPTATSSIFTAPTNTSVRPPNNSPTNTPLPPNTTHPNPTRRPPRPTKTPRN